MIKPTDHHIAFCLGEQTIDFRLGFHPTWVGREVYEKEVVHVIGRFLRPGDFAIDAGANLGFFSLLMSKLVGEQGGVWAFEADPNCFKTLLSNLSMNRAANVVPRAEALWNCDTELDFWLMEESGYSSVIHYDVSKEACRVEARSLDSLFSRPHAPWPRLIKIDCEGSETAVLQGAEAMLRKGIDAVIVEMNFQLMDQIGLSEQHIREYMESLGYDFFLLPKDGTHPIYIQPGDRVRVVGGFPNMLNTLFSTRAKVDQLWGLPIDIDRAEANLLNLKRDVNKLAFYSLGNRVLNGPFAGMRIPEVTPWDDGNSSTKLLGTYERELHGVVRDVVDGGPPVIVNIGCAEGYYAIGLAMRLPNTIVHALDISDESLAACRTYAETNGVGERVVTRNVSDGDISVSAGWPRVYLVDCEGGEEFCLDKQRFPELAVSDIIVECHDYLVEGVTDTLVERFSDTHSIERIHTGLPDFRLMETLLRESPAIVSAMALVENRPKQTVWLVCRARQLKERENG